MLNIRVYKPLILLLENESYLEMKIVVEFCNLYWEMVLHLIN